MVRPTNQQLTNLLAALAAFVISLGLLLHSAPLSRPSRSDQMAFELGYYNAACSDEGLRSNAQAILPEILRLSAALGASPTAKDRRCPPADAASQMRRELSRQQYGSFLLGTDVARLELSRLTRSERALFLLDGELPKLARALFPAKLGALQAIYSLQAGTLDATEFHRRMYRPESSLRYQVSADLDAPRRAFALGFHAAKCLALAGSERVALILEEMRGLASSLSVSLGTDDSQVQRCIPVDSPEPLATQLDWTLVPFLHLGWCVSAYETLHTLDPLTKQTELKGEMVQLLERLGFESARPHLYGFLSGRVDVDHLYQRLFRTESALTQISRSREARR